MASVSVRYIVDDVAAAIAFYCEQLEFHEVMHPAATFAMLDRRPGNARRHEARTRRMEPNDH
jgi:catechol 2,3-dioxygenase-like lactoylglutathione lyase family enzyme